MPCPMRLDRRSQPRTVTNPDGSGPFRQVYALLVSNAKHQDRLQSRPVRSDEVIEKDQSSIDSPGVRPKRLFENNKSNEQDG